jgi:S-layer protein
MALIPTSTAIVQSFAGALYGKQIGSVTLTSVNNDINNLGLNTTLNSYFNYTFGSMTAAQVANLMVTNLGIANGKDNAVAYVVGQLNAANKLAWGQTVSGILQAFSGLTADATYGAAAAAWNTQIEAAAAYTGATDVAIGTVVSTFTLTAGVDTVAGTAGNDAINATDATLTSLDSIDGGAGSNVLNFTDVTGGTVLHTSISVKNVQTVNVISAGDVGFSSSARFDVSGLTSVTALNVTRAYGNEFINAGDGQAVTVSGGPVGGTVDVVATTGAVSITAAGAVTVAGGSTQTVATKGGVNLTGATGAVVATDTAQGSADQTITGGTSNTLTTTVALVGATNTQAGVNVANHSKVTIGATGHLPTGAVTLTENIVGDKTANAWAGNIVVNGGTTVNVTEAATQAIATQSTTAGATTTNYKATQAQVTVNGSTATTAVTVNQTAAVATVNSVTAKAGVQEVDTVTLSSTLTDGSSVTVGGLTFTNNSGATMTAAQVAAAFANLTSGATAGKSTLGVYSGSFQSGFSTGAVTNTSSTVSTITATATAAADASVATITATGPSVALATAGVTAVAAVAGVGGIGNGDVYVTDYGYNDSAKADSITTITLNGYASGTLNSDALVNLSLANAKDAEVDVQNTKATALNLTVNNLAATTAGSLSILNLDADASAEYKTLAVTATGANSTVKVVGAAVEALTVSGDKSLNLTGSTFTNLKTVTISGSAGVTAASAFTGSAVTDVNASGTSGAVSASINASLATYEGSTGADTITLTSTTVSKAVALGAGDDTLNLASGTTSLTAIVDGGAGTDTLGIAAADAATASANNLFMAKFTGFEKLSLGQVAAGASNSVDLSNMNGISYVASANAVNAATALTVVTTPGTGSSTETAAITFKALTVGQSTTVAGRTVTATGDATGAQVATAMKTGTAAGNLTVSGTVTGWTMGTVSSADLTFTSTTANTDVTNISTSSSAVGALTITKMANGGTLELDAVGAGATVTMTDATGAADSLNVLVKNASGINAGTVTVAGVETINLTATDTDTTAIGTHTISLADAALKTVVITGNAGVTLTTNSAVLTSVDGSAMTAALTAATNGTVTQTILGGAGADSLTANGTSDVLNGGAGNDTLIVHAGLVSLTGGGGNDTFDVTYVTGLNVNSYATITDAAAGDKIKFDSNAASFKAAKVTLADTAVFQDYANAAISGSSDNAVSWFQYGGATYVIENGVGAATSFTNGTDIIVKLAGLVDLSTASFSSSAHTLQLN